MYCNKIINLDEWRLDERFEGVYPEGAREKEVYFSPVNLDIPSIKDDWRYIFKLPHSNEWCPWQFWVEIIAYRLGVLIGVPVPPTHVGYKEKYLLKSETSRHAYGALIEWFYDFKQDIHYTAGPFMRKEIENYDQLKVLNITLK